MSLPHAILDNPTRILLFTGKGGVGKTSLACATAVTLAGRGKRVLIVSTDPASNLDEVLQTAIGTSAVPVAIAGEPNLSALNIDPEAAAHSYRERVVGPYRNLLPDAALASMEEQLSGACTVEIAAFDEFTKLVADREATADFDHVIFDTAPTGHTLRLLKLPGAWTEFIATNSTGTSCLGPLAGLQAQRGLYERSLQTLTDANTTSVVLVSRPERAALAEAARTLTELQGAGISPRVFALNGAFRADGSSDRAARALEMRTSQAIAEMPESLLPLLRLEVPILPFAPLGVDALRQVFARESPEGARWREQAPREQVEHRSMLPLIDEIEKSGRGVILAMGKGGVGKTTVAAAVAVELARRGHRVHLSTTDPAAHIADAVGDGVPGMSVSRIDPALETGRYAEQVLADAGRGLDAQGRAVLEEDLRSPCTEEIAVFRAFAETVAAGKDGFVILDTAPTGHTLLLLDAAEAYHREVLRNSSGMPEPVQQLLPRLRDPLFTRVLLVTLPEATPVHEAERLQNDLRRAGIEPFAWVVNQTVSTVGTTDPVLLERGKREVAYIKEVQCRLAIRAAVLPWNPDEPIGPEALQDLLFAIADSAVT